MLLELIFVLRYSLHSKGLKREIQWTRATFEEASHLFEDTFTDDPR